jgi:hypothetical protein
MESQQKMEQIIGMLTRMQERMIDREDLKEMMAWLTDRNDTRKEAMTCLEKTKARLGKEEPASEDMEPEVADAARMPVGEPRNRRRD